MSATVEYWGSNKTCCRQLCCQQLAAGKKKNKQTNKKNLNCMLAECQPMTQRQPPETNFPVLFMLFCFLGTKIENFRDTHQQKFYIVTKKRKPKQGTRVFWQNTTACKPIFSCCYNSCFCLLACASGAWVGISSSIRLMKSVFSVQPWNPETPSKTRKSQQNRTECFFLVQEKWTQTGFLLLSQELSKSFKKTQKFERCLAE